MSLGTRFGCLWRVFIVSIGSVLISVTLPVLLCCFNNAREFSDGGASTQNTLMALAASAGFLEMFAAIFCGPGAIVLGLLLYANLSSFKEAEPDKLAFTGMWRGALISFLNLPGFLAIEFLHHNEFLMPVRIISLFLVAGGTTGLWIGWHVCREQRPELPIIPRYRLSTLLIVVFAWGALLTLFAPDKK